MAAYDAFKKASNSNIHFCLFHFGQCIHWKIQALGQSKDYQINIDLRFFIKCVTSLAFVPTYFVEKEFEKLKKRIGLLQNVKLQPFLNILRKTFWKIQNIQLIRGMHIVEYLPIQKISLQTQQKHSIEISIPGLINPIQGYQPLLKN